MSPDQSLSKSLRTPPSPFSNELVEGLHEITLLQLIPHRRVHHVPTPVDLSTKTLSGPAQGMALASAYAMGHSKAEICSIAYEPSR